MRHLIEKMEQIVRDDSKPLSEGVGSFAKTVSSFSERVKGAASSAKFVKDQVERVARAKWGMDAMDIQELDGHLRKAEESLRDAGVILDTFKDLLK